MMKLQAPTLEDCQQVRIWRNEVLETLRTPYSLTPEMQEDFYHNVICNRNSNHRYWSIIEEGSKPKNSQEFEKHSILIGFGGFTFIEWENSQAEISLIINPVLRGKGYGEKAVHLLLDQAFNYLGLNLIYGECYMTVNGAFEFWKAIIDKLKMQSTIIRKGKYCNGQHYWTLYFDITKDEFKFGKSKDIEV